MTITSTTPGPGSWGDRRIENGQASIRPQGARRARYGALQIPRIVQAGVKDCQAERPRLERRPFEIALNRQQTVHDR
jgi:hypothetical protein